MIYGWRTRSTVKTCSSKGQPQWLIRKLVSEDAVQEEALEFVCGSLKVFFIIDIKSKGSIRETKRLSVCDKNIFNQEFCNIGKNNNWENSIENLIECLNWNMK